MSTVVDMGENVHGKVAVVTGATSGIGLATSEELAGRGYSVVATGRRTRPQSLPSDASYVAMDVTDVENIRVAIDEIVRQFGRIDLLVNNAGFGQLGALGAITTDQLRHQFEVNVFGAHAVTRAVLPVMTAQYSGRIINIGSVGGTFTAPGAGAYHMSKWALESFSDALRFESRPLGIDVIHIQPTGVRTGFVDTIVTTLPEAPDDSPFTVFHSNVSQRTTEMFAGRAPGIISAAAVARSVGRAADARRPRTRYMIGFSAYAYRNLRRVTSDRVWDRIMGMAFPFPAGKP
jgi:NAD(P)-dependent dehydrogenase (short-subunit alcohol dehydrogenase family)